MDAYHRARNGIATPKERNHFDYLCSHKGFTRAIGDMIVGARQRAQLRQCDFTITREDLISRLEAQRGLCAVTGVPFSLAGKLKGAKRPNRMSVDRIDRTGGYTPGNFRITTAIANVAMMDWEFEDFVDMCRAVAELHRRRGTPLLSEQVMKVKRANSPR